jgi:hypothetical protein
MSWSIVVTNVPLPAAMGFLRLSISGCTLPHFQAENPYAPIPDCRVEQVLQPRSARFGSARPHTHDVTTGLDLA